MAWKPGLQQLHCAPHSLFAGVLVIAIEIDPQFLARLVQIRPQTGVILNSLAAYHAVYFSAITLSIYGDQGRARLFAALSRARQEGTRIAFDTNFRARGWPDLDVARRVFTQAFETADIALASTEDLQPLWPGETSQSLLAHIASPEAVLKLAEPASIVRFKGAVEEVMAEPPAKPVVEGADL